MSVRTRILLTFLLAGVVLFGGIGAPTLFLMSRRYNAQFVRGKLALARQLAFTVDGTEHAALRHPRDVDSAAFQRYHRWMRELLRTEPYITYVYSLRYDSETDALYYVVDAGSREENPALDEPHPPGTSFEDTLDHIATIKGVVQNNKEQFNLNAEQTAHGKVLSVMAPIRERSGAANGVVIIEISTRALAGFRKSFVRRASVALFISLIVLAILAYVFSRYLTRPIRELSTGVNEIAAGHLDYRLPVDRKDEFGRLARAFNDMTDGLLRAMNDLGRTSEAYRRFVPGEFVRYLGRDNIWEVEAGDHVSRDMTVLFSDIRSFTTLSESMTPAENFNFINSFLGQVSPIVRGHGGIIVKYLGDGMMALFPKQPDDAVRAGIAKLAQVRDYNRARRERHHLPIALGLGVHSGYMMVGVVGDKQRLQGDAFSDNVNLASRLEGLTRHYGVSMVCSNAVVDTLQNPEEFRFRFLDRIIVKGRKEPVDVYECLDGERPAVAEQKWESRDRFHEAMDHYRNRRFPEAMQLFHDILQENPSDWPARLYTERITLLMIQEVPEDWVPVHELDEK